MSVAKNALEELSQDPEALRIARERETAVLMHRHLINSSREEGRAEGREEGRAEGREEGRAEGETKGLRAAIESMCLAFEIDVDAERSAKLTSLDVDQLKRVVDAIAAQRTWPEDL